MKEQIIAIAKTAKTFLGKNSPAIMVGIGIAGFCTAIIFTAKAAPEVEKDLDELEARYQDLDGTEPPKKEKVRIYVKRYWPAAVSFAASAASVIFALVVQTHRTAVATTAYILTQDSLQAITKKATEKIGEKGVTEIKEDISKERYEKFKKASEQPVVIHRTGDTLCYDEIAGRYFYSSVEVIRKAESDLNKRIIRENFISLNEFYSEIELPHIQFGDDLGWDVMLEGSVNIELSAQLSENSEPCLVVSADICPRWALNG